MLIVLYSDEEEDSTTTRSLLFGSLKKQVSDSPPVLKMPLEYGQLWDEVRLSKSWKVISSRADICKGLRVSKEEFDRFFSVPQMDSQIQASLLGRLSSSSSTPAASSASFAQSNPPSFSRVMEEEMIALDAHLRIIHRLSVFQWIILNSLTIDLQPLDGTIQAELGVSDKSQLATEIAAQILKHSIAISNRTIINRRVNACAGLSSKYMKSFVDELKIVKKEDDMSKLFGGKIDKMVRSKAKETKNLSILSKVAVNPRKRSSGRRPSSFATPSSASSSFPASSSVRGGHVEDMPIRVVLGPSGLHLIEVVRGSSQ